MVLRCVEGEEELHAAMTPVHQAMPHNAVPGQGAAGPSRHDELGKSGRFGHKA